MSDYYPEFPDELQNSLWHTTSLERYKMILETGCVLAEPNIPDSDRWCNPKDPNGYPYVRILGGISLFEFNDFDPVSYGKKCQMSCWDHFVPYKRSWGASVWIEIDRDQISSHFLSAEELIKKWHEDKKYNNVMPHIEAACLAPIPVTAFIRVLAYREDQPEFTDISKSVNSQ